MYAPPLLQSLDPPLGRRRRDKEISMARLALCDEELQPQAVTTSLGVAIDSQLTWREHVKRVRQKCFVGLTKLRRIGRNVPMTTRKMLYSALILPHVDYCSIVWDQLTKDLERKVETIQNVGMRIILNAPRMATGTEMRQKLGWCTLAQRRKLHPLKLAHKCLHNVGPTYLHHKFRYTSDVSGICT